MGGLDHVYWRSRVGTETIGGVRVGLTLHGHEIKYSI